MAKKEGDLAKLVSLNRQVSQLYQAGKFSEAIPIAQESLELSKKALSPDHPAPPRPLFIGKNALSQKNGEVTTKITTNPRIFARVSHVQ
jgi:hypothetical protein